MSDENAKPPRRGKSRARPSARRRTAALRLAGALWLTAAAALAQEMDTGGKGLGELIAMLEAPDALVRLEAARQLGTMGPEAAEALPGLAARLDDAAESSEVRSMAAFALAMADARAAIPPLLRALACGDPGTSEAAAEALACLGPDALPLLRETAASADAFEREIALLALEALEAQAPGQSAPGSEC